MKGRPSNYLINILNDTKDIFNFWHWAVALFIVSNFIIFILSCLLNVEFALHASSLFRPPITQNICFGIIWSEPENTRYILSALSQVQAAIFGVFFTAYFIISQIQIQNKAASPKLVREWRNSRSLIFVFFTYIVSITLDLVLLRCVEREGVLEINIFWALSISMFAILILLHYVRTSLPDLFSNSLIEEIRSDSARYNLEEAHLNGFELACANLNGRCLKKAKLIGAKLVHVGMNEVDLREADLTNANLTNAELKKAKLCWANLNNANLSNADLSDAYLIGSNLSNTILTQSNLLNADLSMVYFYDYTYHAGKSLKSIKYIDILNDCNSVLSNLLESKNLGRAIIDRELKKALIIKAEELINKANSDVDYDKEDLNIILQQLKNS